MTDSSNNDDKNSVGNDDTVIEAEVISEGQPAPKDRKKHPDTIETPTIAKPRKTGIQWSRAGWWLSLVLAAFIGGLLAEPFVRPQLVWLGLRDSETTTDPEVTRSDLAIAQNRISALEGTVERLSTDLAASPTTKPDDQTEKLSNLSAQILALESGLADLTARISNRPQTDEADTEPAQGSLGVPTKSGPTNFVQQDQIESLTALEDALAATTVETATRKDLDAIRTEITAARQRIAVLDSQSDQAQSALLTLQTALDRQVEASSTVSPTGRLILLMARARDKALNGEDFSGDLVLLETAIREIPAETQSALDGPIATLRALADRPIATVAALKEQFTLDAVEAVAAADKASGRFLAGLFTTRSKTETSGVEGLLNRAEIRLEARDIAGTSEILLELDESVRTAFDDWQQKARMHVTALAAFDQMGRILGGTPPPASIPSRPQIDTPPAPEADAAETLKQGQDNAKENSRP